MRGDLETVSRALLPVRLSPLAQDWGNPMLEFFIENPVIAAMTLLVVLLVLALPVGFLQRRYSKDGRTDKVAVKESRFMGTGMDLALLLFAVLILVAVIGAAMRAIG